jgi:hypothetical protein
MQSSVQVIRAFEFSAREAMVPSAYRLRFPAHWRASPVQNRYFEAIERDTIAWLNRYGIGCRASEREKLRKFSCGMYGGYSLPLAAFSTALLVTQFISLWLFWDDVEIEDDVTWSVDDVVAALSASPSIKKTSRYVAAWADLGKRLQHMTSATWLSRLGRTMREWLTNAKIETRLGRAFRSEGKCPDVDTLFECRTISIGMFPTFHLIELTEGIELDDSFHEHAAVRSLKRTASRLVGMGNDLGGVAKDILHRWLNLVLALAERSSLGVEDAFGRIVDLHNEEVVAFDREAACLPSFGPAIDPFVVGWVQAVRHNVYGFALWESVAERYQEHKAIVGNTALLAPTVEY